MSPNEFLEHLNSLDISIDETAQFLGVTRRTVLRWRDGEEIPGPAQAALRAWRSLNDRRLGWKPDSISVLENDADQIERQRLYAIRFNEMLKQVELRGGPVHPWKVDTHRSTATFGTSEVAFYKLANGGFSIGWYRRTDRHPDLQQDLPLIQDAAFCIASEFAKSGERVKALTEMAAYVRENAGTTAREGRITLTPKEAAGRKRHVEQLADKLLKLAEDAREGYASYGLYEDIEEELHAAVFFPKDSHVAAVARAFA